MSIVKSGLKGLAKLAVGLVHEDEKAKKKRRERERDELRKLRLQEARRRANDNCD